MNRKGSMGDTMTRNHSLRKIVFAAFLVAMLGVDSVSAKGPPPDKGGGGGGGGKKEQVDHTARQLRPLQLGVSGGNALDLANGYCCGGTLGSLVEDAVGNQYILSNTHVFAGDSVPGGNGYLSAVGDPVDQPGLIDVGCQNRSADYVATLSTWVDLVPGGASTVDAALAAVLPGEVDSTGAILEIGMISSETVEAFVDQPVKKSGRTSGLTRGQVAALNATVNVSYSDECAGQGFVTTFTGQILVTPGKFIKSGDSGSLMVEDANNNPRAVGLLYAGSRRVAVANPINDVLSVLNVSMVGGASSASASEPSSGQGASARAVEQATLAKERGAATLMKVPGAVGHAVGLSANGDAVIKVLVEELTPTAQQGLPKEIDGVPVEIMEVGHIVAY